jgi:hypothetical protein
VSRRSRTARRPQQSAAAFPGLGPLGEPIPISTGTAVLEQETDGSVLLSVGGVPSSHLDPDPEHLVFEYMRWMQTAIRHWVMENGGADAGRSLQMAHLGGGGCALPRALVHQWPRSRHTVVEIDQLLADHVRVWFDLPRSPQMRIRVQDAAVALHEWREDRFDVLVRDVFAAGVTPRALRGTTAARDAARVLRPGGLYLVNCAAPPGTRELADELATLAGAFTHLEVIAEPAHLSGKRRGNCVILASDTPLPVGIDRSLRSDAVSVRTAGRDLVTSLVASGRVVGD